MNKPTTLLVEEFKNNLIQLINEAELPPFVIEYIIRDLYLEIQNLSVQVAEKEKQDYLAEQANEEPALSD